MKRLYILLDNDVIKLQTENENLVFLYFIENIKSKTMVLKTLCDNQIINTKTFDTHETKQEYYINFNK